MHIVLINLLFKSQSFKLRNDSKEKCLGKSLLKLLYTEKPNCTPSKKDLFQGKIWHQNKITFFQSPLGKEWFVRMKSYFLA